MLSPCVKLLLQNPEISELRFVIVVYVLSVCDIFVVTKVFQLDPVSLHNKQRAKKVVSDSPELVDFAIGLVNSVLN